MNFYDRIYGISLETYCEFHNITKEQLIEKIKKDIALLQSNYDRYAKRNTELTEEELYQVQEIKAYLDRKKQNYERLLKGVKDV